MAALIYLILDPATGEISYTNAGNPPPLIITPDGSVQRLASDSLPLNTPLQPMYEERSRRWLFWRLRDTFARLR